MKKVLSVLLAAAVSLGICACAGAENISVTNTEIKAENIPENGTVIAALYDRDGALTGVRTYRGSETAKYAEDMEKEIKISDSIKVYVWDMEKIQPLGRVYAASLETLAEEESNTMTISINGKSFNAELDDSPTAEAFRNSLPMTLDMSELNGNEKYYYLDSSLPTNASKPGTINTGDIMLYGNNCVVVFYKTFSTPYSYTRIGRITDTSGLEDAVGSGDVEITFSK